MIRKAEIHKLKELMTKSNDIGMQTFDQALYKAYASGEITYEDALAHADSANDLRLLIKLGADSTEPPAGCGQQTVTQDGDDYL